MELQDRLEELTRSGIGVAAISYDSQDILANFAEERGITFPLLSDVDSAVIKAYGILNTVAAADSRPRSRRHGTTRRGADATEPEGRRRTTLFG